VEQVCFPRKHRLCSLFSLKKKKVSMLTPDGKLVEVPKQVLDQINDRKKAANQDILNWTTAPNKTRE
jgi:hypothetical protein